MTRRQIVTEAPPPCECPYYGEPIHDEDPIRFHLEFGYCEDEFMGFHAHRNTRCPRHPTRQLRPLVTPSSSSDEGDGPILAASDHQEPDSRPNPLGLADPSTPLQRNPTPPPPQPHPRWAGALARSIGRKDGLDGLQTSFPSNEKLWNFANPTIMRTTSDPVDTYHRHHRPGLGHVRAQRSQRDLEHRHSHKRTHHTSPEQVLRGIAVSECNTPKPRTWRTLHSGIQQPNAAREPTRTTKAPTATLTDRSRAPPPDDRSDSESSSTLTDLDDHEPTTSHSQRVAHENVLETRLVVQKRLDGIEREAKDHAEGMRKLVAEKRSLLLELGHLKFDERKKV